MTDSVGKEANEKEVDTTETVNDEDDLHIKLREKWQLGGNVEITVMPLQTNLARILRIQ